VQNIPVRDWISRPPEKISDFVLGVMRDQRRKFLNDACARATSPIFSGATASPCYFSSSFPFVFSGAHDLAMGSKARIFTAWLRRLPLCSAVRGL
jgi:hypothetical protein